MTVKRSLLKIIDNEYGDREYEVVLHCPEFTSCCPFTGYPDFGTIDIIYIPRKKCIESKSLKLYMMSYRDEKIFNEHAINRILDDIVSVCKPKRVRVVGVFNVRGGISIRVEAVYPGKTSDSG